MRESVTKTYLHDKNEYRHSVDDWAMQRLELSLMKITKKHVSMRVKLGIYTASDI